MVRDLITGFIRHDWVQNLDLDSLETVKGSYVTPDMRQRHSDIVWRVRMHHQTNNGPWLYLYLLLEFQSRTDTWMALRTLVYAGLLQLDVIKRDKPHCVPPVLPIVLYNGTPRWSATAPPRP